METKDVATLMRAVFALDKWWGWHKRFFREGKAQQQAERMGWIVLARHHGMRLYGLTDEGQKALQAPETPRATAYWPRQADGFPSWRPKRVFTYDMPAPQPQAVTTYAPVVFFDLEAAWDWCRQQNNTRRGGERRYRGWRKRAPGPNQHDWKAVRFRPGVHDRRADMELSPDEFASYSDAVAWCKHRNGMTGALPL